MCHFTVIHTMVFVTIWGISQAYFRCIVNAECRCRAHNSSFGSNPHIFSDIDSRHHVLHLRQQCHRQYVCHFLHQCRFHWLIEGNLRQAQGGGYYNLDVPQRAEKEGEHAMGIGVEEEAEVIAILTRDI